MNMINKVASLVLLSCFFYSGVSAAAATGSAFGAVGEMVAGGPSTGAPAQDLLYFKIVGTPVHADCVIAGKDHFVVKDDAGGRTMIALLLAAKMADKKVHVAGRGTCTYISGFEDASYIYID